MIFNMESIKKSQDYRKDDDGYYTCSVENKYGAIQHTIRVSLPKSMFNPQTTNICTKMMKVLEEMIRIDRNHIKVKSVEHVVAQGPTFHHSQPGNHTGNQTKPSSV